jgi:hypothetical protein
MMDPNPTLARSWSGSPAFPGFKKKGKIFLWTKMLNLFVKNHRICLPSYRTYRYSFNLDLNERLPFSKRRIKSSFYCGAQCSRSVTFFCTDPDFNTGLRIRIRVLLFSSRCQQRKLFFYAFLLFTYRSYIYNSFQNNLIKRPKTYETRKLSFS